MAKILEQGPSQAEIDAAAAAATGAVENGEAMEDESKADTFKRLAIARTTSALDKIRLIGNLTSANYEYTTEQADKICETLRDAIDALEKKFAKTKEKAKFTF